MPRYEFKILYDDHIEDLLGEITELGQSGWYIVSTITEHAYTKVILQREISN